MAVEFRASRSDDLDQVRERNGVRDQAQMREVNEQVCAFAAAASPDARLLVSCECADLHCSLPLRLSPGEYELIRRHPARFVVKPGHELAVGERVVEWTAGYVVVEKLGEAAAIATRLDPRKGRSAGA